ncbi:MAG TPA: hypothetical protein VKV74_05410 [Bryobacteraceae bacterium]|nr:hypothetical protein [Bryobacteraceae bacterium]
MRKANFAVLSLAMAAGVALGQEAPGAEQNAPASNVTAQDNDGWRRVGGGSNGQSPALQTAPAPQPSAPSAQFDPQYPPAKLTIPPGTFVVVRLNEFLSSDKSRAGDNFTGTLAQPLVVDGYTIANQGQLVVGVVADAQKAVHGQNVSRLQIGLTNLTLVNGNQLPIKTELVASRGPGWTGADTGTVVGTTGLGAAIGAIAGGGPGAAIGAAAGGVAALAGVLLTHGHPVVLPPESVLTFKTSAEATVDTTTSPQSFRQGPPPPQYSQTQQPTLQRRPPYPAAGYPAPGYPAPYYAYPAPYPYYGPYYYPGIYFGIGGWRRW